MAKRDGGPAFPHYTPVDGYYVAAAPAGMSLRDYFAAKAMQAMLTSPNCPMAWTEERLAKQSYITADVMLKIRNIECDH